MADPDDLAATLAKIKRIAACLFPLPPRHALLAEQVAEFVPPLVAAVEAVLEKAGEWDAEARRIDAKFAGEEDAWPRTVAGMRAQAFEQCAKTARAAITEALAKEETP